MSITATLGTDVPGGNIQSEQKFYRALGTLAFTGNYATGGVAVSFVGKIPIPNAVPIDVKIKGIAGYTYAYVKSTKKVKVFETAGFTPAGTNDSSTPPVFTGTAVAAAALVELAAAAFPAGVTGDTVTFEAIFPKV